MCRMILMAGMCLLAMSAEAEQPLVRFGVLADPQYTDHDPEIGRNYRAGKELIRRTIEQFNHEPLDFICNLGDIVDGRIKEELPEVLEIFKTSKAPVKHTLGNHDMLRQTDYDLLKAYGVKSFNETFLLGGVRFVLLHSMEVSVMRPKGTDEYQEAAAYMKDHTERNLKTYNGMLSSTTKQWLEDILTAADAAKEPVVVLTHIPINVEASHITTIFWDAEDMLRLIDRHPSMKAWIAGHHHTGGLAERNHVLHKTVKGLCEMPEATGCIVSVYRDHIDIAGFGKETSYVFHYTE